MFVSYNWFLADYHKVSPLEKTRSKVVSYHFAVAQKYSVDPRGRHNILNGINAFCMMLKNGFWSSGKELLYLTLYGKTKKNFSEL